MYISQTSRLKPDKVFVGKSQTNLPRNSLIAKFPYLDTALIQMSKSRLLMALSKSSKGSRKLPQLFDEVKPNMQQTFTKPDSLINGMALRYVIPKKNNSDRTLMHSAIKKRNYWNGTLLDYNEKFYERSTADKAECQEYTPSEYSGNKYISVTRINDRSGLFSVNKICNISLFRKMKIEPKTLTEGFNTKKIGGSRQSLKSPIIKRSPRNLNIKIKNSRIIKGSSYYKNNFSLKINEGKEIDEKNVLLSEISKYSSSTDKEKQSN